MQRQVAFAAGYARGADLVLLEAPSFGSKGSATRDLAGLWWLMVAELLEQPAPLGVVAPSVLKKWVTGSGAADKFRVGQHIAKRWPDLELRSDDQADALGLASIGLHHARVLPWEPTVFQTEALAKVEWNSAHTGVPA
jgi:crossover junction endodeoxyribonuclease RuvC